MRTTLVLDDMLLRAARHRAIDLGLTLSDFVNRALREALAGATEAQRPPLSLPTYGGPNEVDHAPADLWKMIEKDDIDAVREG